MLDKAIKYGKEHRKEYYNSGRFDISCRPHGMCGYCRGTRAYDIVKRLPAYDDAEIELLNDIDVMDYRFVKEVNLKDPF